MWFLYLDESGDLGFDFVNKRPSRFFTILILAIQGVENNKKLIGAVKKTISRKLNKKKNKKRLIEELKGSSAILGVKKYFFGQVRDIPFVIFSETLNKIKVYERLTREKDRIYNYIARRVLDQIRFENADIGVDLVVDKSKSQKQIREFNQYIIRQLKARLNPNISLNILHRNSIAYHGIQAADIFSWGIFRTYERDDFEWYNIFRSKVKYNELFL